MPSGSKTTDGGKQAEAEIKEAFGELQAAIKAKNADKIWSLIDKDTQADAEQQARLVKESFARASEPDKSAMEKQFGLSAKELTEITGKLYVQSKEFYDGETEEIPGSTLEKITVKGETLNVHYIEDDGKKGDSRPVVRENGRWKFVLPVPKARVK